MADDKIIIELDLDSKQVTSSLGKIENKADKSAKKTEKAFSSSFKRLLGPIAALGAALGAAFAGRKIIEAASRQQDAINQLNTSLRLAGTFSREASKDIQAFASELQKTTTIGDETTLEFFSLARNFVNTNEEAKKLTKAAVELSAATGLTLESSVKNLGKTFAGLTGELGESLPQLRGLSAEALKSGAALDFVLERFGGAAAAQVNTFSGAINQAGNIFGDLLEKIGQLVVDSPVVTAIINEISKGLLKASDGVKEFGKSGDVIGVIILKLIKFAEAVNTFLVVPIEFAINEINIAFDGLVAGLQFGISKIAGAASKFASFFSPDSELASNLKTFAESSNEVFNEAANKSNESLNNLFNFDFATKSAQVLEDLRLTTEQALATQKMGLDALNDQAEQTSGKSKKIVLDISKTIQQGIVNATVNGIAAVGSALVKGENAFAAFGKQVLSIMGDIAITIGKTLIGIGLGIEKLKASLTFLSGGLAIAAGFALVALGGALKALGGGAGLGATPAAGADAGGGGGLAEPTIDAGLEEPEDLEGRQAITVNVDGAVLDPVGTGQQIVAVLQETFDTTGSQVVTNVG